MRVQLPAGIYTQINTDESTFLIQNVSSEDLHIIVSDTTPAAQADYDYVIEPKCGISNNHVEGLCWGKPQGKTAITVGLTEG